MIARLALEDGTVFTGHSVGAEGTRTGEVVFNTAMTGYQEIFTDPSYCGQIVTMTFPLQGNYGVNPDDTESAGTPLSGVVLRELPRRPSNYRASGSLSDYLVRKNIIGLAGVDTRALTRRVRVHGAMRGAISTEHGEAELAVWDTGERWTFTEHARLVASVAAALADKHGIKKGSRVAILAANRPEWVLAAWAALVHGAVVVAMNGWWQGD